QVGIRAEISYLASESAAVYSVGSTAGTSPAGYWLANLAHVGNGVYEVEVHPLPYWMQERMFGIAFMLETTDASGATDDDRNIAFLGSRLDVQALYDGERLRHALPLTAAVASSLTAAFATVTATEPATVATAATEPATTPDSSAAIAVAAALGPFEASAVAGAPAAALPAATVALAGAAGLSLAFPPAKLSSKCSSVKQLSAVAELVEGASSSFTALTSGPALALDGSYSTARRAAQRSFGFFNRFRPQSAGIITTSIQGFNFLSRSHFVTLGLSNAADANLVVRTQTLYVDRSELAVAYQLRDAAGRTSFVTTDLTVELTIEHDSVEAATAVTCSAPSTGGIGYCAAILATDFFSSQAAGTVSLTLVAKYGQAAAATTSATVALARSPAHGSLGTVGMLAEMVGSPVFPTDEFDVSVLGSTSVFVLKSYSLKLTYNTSVLEYVSASVGSLWASLTTPIDGANGQISITVIDVASGTTDAQVTGTNVLLMSVRFRVKASASAGTHTGALSILALTMNSTNSAQFLPATPGIVLDHRDGSHSSGQLAVEAVAASGAHAYAASAELVNTAPLTGEAVKTQVTVVEHYNRAATTSATAATSAYACSSTNTSVFDVDAASCLVSLTPAQMHGSAAVSVAVSSASGPVGTTALLRVWFPVAASLRISDSSLQRVEGLHRIGACKQPGHQTGELTLVADFGGEGLATVSDLDVTSLATFASSNAAVASVSGAMVTGLSAGVVNVTLGNGATAGASTAVDVSSSSVSANLTAVVVTSVSWITQPPSTVPATPADFSFTASSQIAQELKLEGDSAGVYGYATFSDGTSSVIASTDLVVTSLTDSLYAIQGGVSQPAKVNIAFGAIYGCDELVRLEWKVCDLVVASDTAPVFLNLPLPIGLTITSPQARLTSPVDQSSQAPVSVKTSATITATVDYDSGAAADFSLDARTTITLDAASQTCATVLHRTVSMMDNATCSEITVLVAVPWYGLAQNLTLPVVYLKQLYVYATPYPTYSGSSSKGMGTLHKIDCTAHYQHATPAAYAILTDATQYTVTSATSFTSTSPAVISTSGVGLGSRLRGTSVGSATITATWAEALSEPFEVVVTDDEVAISSLQLATNGLSGFDTLTGVTGTTKSTRVQVIFDDGTQFTNFFTRVDWIPTSDLLAFTSSTPTAASISTQGVITLHDNHYEYITMTVISACDSEMMNARTMAANLAAGVGDVDLGNKLGVQFDQAGDTVEVPVRINAD
ncbi:hypothetical protein T492DRAFT_878666, partial [Pavlovales sp. CCMP2436]